MIKLAAVMVLYNPDKKVKENIKKLIKEVDKLYLVDNSDNNNFGKEMLDKKIEYLPNNKNLGIASALNIGAKQAIKDKFKWLLTMDQDSYFKENHLSEMKKLIENEEENIAVFSPVHLTEYKIDHNPLVVMTSGNIINLEIYEKINGFDEKLFIDCVDFDYCLKSRTNGYKIKLLESIKLNHNLGNIIVKKVFNKKIILSNHNPIRRYYITRNRLYINKKYKNIYKDFCKKELKNTFRENIKIILFEKNKAKKIYYSLKGVIDYLNKRKGAINEK